jgi:hypothetical protein
MEGLIWNAGGDERRSDAGHPKAKRSSMAYDHPGTSSEFLPPAKRAFGRAAFLEASSRPHFPRLPRTRSFPRQSAVTQSHAIEDHADARSSRLFFTFLTRTILWDNHGALLRSQLLKVVINHDGSLLMLGVDRSQKIYRTDCYLHRSPT